MFGVEIILFLNSTDLDIYVPASGEYVMTEY